MAATTVAEAGAKPGATSSQRNVATAMAIAGRASRACDVCGSQRARWFCAADDAHLCQRCDNNVHSANALAHRHERVRLHHNGISSTSKQQLTAAAAATTTKRSSETAQEHHSNLRSSSQQEETQPQTPPPSRKRSRLSRRPNTHVRAPASSNLKPQQKSGSTNFHHHRKVKADSTHEVPTFITVNIQESNLGFHHETASAISLAEYCKSKVSISKPVKHKQHNHHNNKNSVVEVDDDATSEVSGDSSDQFRVPCSNSDDGGYLPEFDEAGHPFGGDIPFMEDGSMGLCGGNGGDYNLDFSDIVGMEDGDGDGEGDGDAFEGDCGETTSEAGCGGLAADNLEARGSCDPDMPFAFASVLPYKVKSEFYAPDSLDLIKKEVAAVLRGSLEGGGGKEEADMKPAPSLLRLNYEDVLSAWSDRSLWTDGKRPQTVPEDSNSEAAVRSLSLSRSLTHTHTHGTLVTEEDICLLRIIQACLIWILF